jgi:hypothetical protein
MTRHAIRATPWLFLGAAAALVTAMLRVLEQWSYTMWPLQGVAVGLLAGAAAWAYDEPAAAVVDTLPRGLAWRTAARGTSVLALLVWWTASVAWTRPAYFGHAVDVWWQGVAAVLAVSAAVTWQRRRGLASPARLAATVAVGAAAYLALLRPFEDSLPVFPYTPDGPWADSRAWWSALAAAALVMLWTAMTETRLPRVRAHYELEKTAGPPSSP